MIDHNFIKVITDKMEARNVDQRVIEFAQACPQDFYTKYDIDDPDDIVILNNKIEQAYAMFAENSSDATKLSAAEIKKLKYLFGSKF